MTKYTNDTTVVLQEKTGVGKYAQAISAFIKAYRQSMDQYGEAIIRVKAK